MLTGYTTIERERASVSSATLAVVPPRKVLDLVGLNEIGNMVGVTRQRAFMLARRLDFPEPVANLATGRLWRRVDVERWANKWDRSPGRHTHRRNGEVKRREQARSAPQRGRGSPENK